jgi:cytidine deaminase
MAAGIAQPTLTPISELTPVYQKLCKTAMKVSKNGYAPYSGFLVGAALRHKDGRTITPGCNCENCIYQACCAERCSIVAANAQGRRTAWACAVYGNSSLEHVKVPPETLVTPCGNCRQLLNEVAVLSKCDIKLFLVATGGQFVSIVNLSTLLPHSFGPADAGLNIEAWIPSEECGEMPTILSADVPPGTEPPTPAGTPLVATKQS